MNNTSADLVITGCSALVHESQEGLAFLDDATIVVRDGVIESVTAGGAAPEDGVGSASTPAASWRCPA